MTSFSFASNPENVSARLGRAGVTLGVLSCSPTELTERLRAVFPDIMISRPEAEMQAKYMMK